MIHSADTGSHHIVNNNVAIVTDSAEIPEGVTNMSTYPLGMHTCKELLVSVSCFCEFCME
jgi:hypothetical protein